MLRRLVAARLPVLGIGPRSLVKLILAQLVVIQLIAVQTSIADRYRFAAIDGLFEQQVGAYLLPCIYRQLGHDIVIVDYPAKRAQAFANSGNVDGEVMRIYNYAMDAPNTLRVPTPFYQLETSAFFTRDKDFSQLSLEQIKALRVVKVRGVKHTKFITDGFKNVRDLSSSEQMFLYLLAGRADIALTNTSNGVHTIKRLGLDDAFSRIAEPLDVQPLYHYVHKSRAELVPALDRAIQSQIASGELQARAREAEALLYMGTSPGAAATCSAQSVALDNR
ncbi:substrate-binding periplasmic protein [Agaribacterium haliotis]|uniref:substrate-binding periplasmic protein n=1 Tax=Agaribacterium haliotis TaxID=2013869 RepID=UPI000BB597D1|nr:transporter substrate-binding domain-containing protein [Agaribacterium haliotis]